MPRPPNLAAFPLMDPPHFTPPTTKTPPKITPYLRIKSDPRDELRIFRFSLFYLALDQSTALRLAVSWTVASFLALLVPILYLALVRCCGCDTAHGHPFDRVVQISEAALAFISFACLSHNLRKYGLRRFLFLDQISEETSEVQNGYKAELCKAFQLLAWILLPSFLVELVYQVWWFTYASVQLPFIQSSAAKNTIMCFVVMVSWLYRTAVFLLPCILFRLMCCLQSLRFEGYTKMLESSPEVSVILREHMRLRRQLNIISHRYRMFIVLSLVTVTVSQFSFLLMITATSGSVNFFKAGDLAVCSAVQLVGFVICLHGAARITHRAQRVVSTVSQWHAMYTCQLPSMTVPDNEGSNSNSVDLVESDRLLGKECDGDLDSSFSVYWNYNEKMSNDVASFQMRQALVSYLQHDQAGVSLYGYLLDRSFIYALASVELSLVLFILGLTIGID